MNFFLGIGSDVVYQPRTKTLEIMLISVTERMLQQVPLKPYSSLQLGFVNFKTPNNALT